MKHIHADLMAAYAADAQTTDKPWELWESHNTEVKIEWYTLKSDPSWNPSFEYRRKPEPCYTLEQVHYAVEEYLALICEPNADHIVGLVLDAMNFWAEGNNNE